jgi:hypothetical protein
LFCALRFRSQSGAYRFCVGHQGVSHKLQVFYGPFGSFFVAGAAGVVDEHWDVTKVGTVTDGRLDADFGGNPNDDKGIDAAVSQSNVEPCAFEGRHRKLVENTFLGEG